MTGMGNRWAFQEQEISQYREDEGSVPKSCIAIDINGLKQVNDTYGHQAGDEMIRDAGECIQQIFKGKGKAYRIGGDEFVVILRGVAEEEIVRYLEQLDNLIAERNLQREQRLEIAWGYAVEGEAWKPLRQLFAEADAQMYRRKRQMKQQKNEHH